MDTGDIIEQYPLTILKHDTVEKLKTRIHKIEHKHYPNVIKKLLKEEI